MKRKMHFVTYFLGGVMSSVLIKKCVFATTNNIVVALIAFLIWNIWYSVSLARDVCEK